MPSLTPALLALGDRAFRIGDAGRHRFVAEHVFAGARRRDDLFGVHRVRRMNRDDRHVRVAEHVFVARVGVLCAELARERVRTALVAARHGDELVALERR